MPEFFSTKGTGSGRRFHTLWYFRGLGNAGVIRDSDMIKRAGKTGLGCLALAGLLAASWALAAEPVAGGNGDAGPGRAGERQRLLEKVLLETARQVSVKDHAAAFRQQAVRDFCRYDGCAAEPAGPVLTPAAVEGVVKNELAAEARRVHPDPDAAALERAASAAFPLVKKGETVSIVYQYNPVRRSSATGVFHGINGGAVLVGGHRILLRDLRPPPDGEACFARFDAALTAERRQAFITARQTAVADARAAWVERELRARLAAAQLAAVAANEKRGYLWWGGEWRTVGEVVADRAQAERTLLREAWERAHPVAPAVSVTPVAVKPVVTSVVTPAVPVPAGLPPKTSVAPPVVVPAVTVPKPAAVEKPAAVATSPKPAVSVAPVPVPTVASGEPAGPPARRLWILALIPLVLGGGGWLALRQMRGLQRHGWWHGNRDAAEKGFWAPARSAGWPHVAYSFPDHESARRAMGQLGFVEVAKTGELLSREMVHFGIYEVENQFIAFAGGAAMSFIMWRECVAVFGRGNGAASFQVSEAPGLNLELPDTGQLSSPAAQVQFDRDYDGEEDDYRHYVLFKGPGEAGARAFLRRLAPPPQGIHLVVETPAGQWGRDADGYYKE